MVKNFRKVCTDIENVATFRKRRQMYVMYGKGGKKVYNSTHLRSRSKNNENMEGNNSTSHSKNIIRLVKLKIHNSLFQFSLSLSVTLSLSLTLFPLFLSLPLIPHILVCGGCCILSLLVYSPYVPPCRRGVAPRTFFNLCKSFLHCLATFLSNPFRSIVWDIRV